METIELNNYKIDFYSEEPFFHIHQPSDSEWWSIEIQTSVDGETDWFTCEEATKHNYCAYAGLASEINEELAEKMVYKITESDLDEVELSLPIEERFSGYRDYKDRAYSTKTAKQSFQTLSELPYCVITKLK